jgi:hypothetical protein
MEQGTVAAHAFHERVCFNVGLKVTFPAFFTETMLADVSIEESVLVTADIASADRGMELVGIWVLRRVSDLVPILLHILKVVTELFDIPLELPEQQQTPSLLQRSHLLRSLQLMHHLIKKRIIRQHLKLFSRVTILINRIFLNVLALPILSVIFTTAIVAVVLVLVFVVLVLVVVVAWLFVHFEVRWGLVCWVLRVLRVLRWFLFCKAFKLDLYDCYCRFVFYKST